MTEDQILLINKPAQWTSFDVVKYIRKALKGKKIGHAGTLDPLATGLLILCTGKMTKKIPEIQDTEKEYTGAFVLGATTPSYDLETEIVPAGDYSGITHLEIARAAAKFTGIIEQVPPAHSAVKLGGRRAYSMARNNENVELKPRRVVVSEFEITRIDLPLVFFRVICSKGTYIRSLAHDLGKELGCGAYLGELCRIRIGNYSIEEALDPAEFNRKNTDSQTIKGR